MVRGTGGLPAWHPGVAQALPADETIQVADTVVLRPDPEEASV